MTNKTGSGSSHTPRLHLYFFYNFPCCLRLTNTLLYKTTPGLYFILSESCIQIVLYQLLFLNSAIKSHTIDQILLNFGVYVRKLFLVLNIHYKHALLWRMFSYFIRQFYYIIFKLTTNFSGGVSTVIS